MSKIPRSVKLDKHMWDQLQIVADEMHVTRNRLIEELLKRSLHRYFLRERKRKSGGVKANNG